MERTTDQPSAAVRPKTARMQPDTSGPGPFDGPDQQSEGGQFGGNAERRGHLTAVRDEQDNDRDDSRGIHDCRADREVGENRDERTLRNGDIAQGSRGEQPAPSATLDAFAPVLEAWKQVLKSWSELTETMVKAQQDAFASLLGAADATAKEFNVGDRHNADPAWSRSRTTASTPDRIERDRR